MMDSQGNLKNVTDDFLVFKKLVSKLFPIKRDFETREKLEHSIELSLQIVKKSRMKVRVIDNSDNSLSSLY